eukprot:6210761-Pleurochrysis_carterae.AAC.1
MLPSAEFWRLHCHGQVSSFLYFVVEVSNGRALRFDAVWEHSVDIPPFSANNGTAVDFLKAVIDSDVGTRIIHTITLSEAVVVQIYKFLCGMDTPTASAFAKCGLPAPQIFLSSLHYSQRVATACDKALKRLSAALARKERGKGEGAAKKSVSLFEWFKYCLKNRKTDPELAGLGIAAAEEKLLL